MIRSGKAHSRKRRPRPLAPPPTWSARRYLRVAPADIALFRFLLEARDNLALFTVVDKHKGVLLLRCSPDQEGEVDRFLADIFTQLPLLIVLLTTNKNSASPEPTN